MCPIKTTQKDIGLRDVSCLISGNGVTMFKGHMPLKVFSILSLSLLKEDMVDRYLYKRKATTSRATLTLKNAANSKPLLRAMMLGAVSLSESLKPEDLNSG
jgi:hypothetical protein